MGYGGGSVLGMDNIWIYWSPKNHAFGGHLCCWSQKFRSPHEIAVQNVHISMEYPCSPQIDVYCQTLGHFRLFLLENWGCFGGDGLTRAGQ